MLDPQHLRDSHYRTDRNLSKRLALHARFSTNPQPWFAWLFTQLPVAANARILDVGAGTGTLWADNRHRLPGDLHLTIADLSDGMLATAQANLDTLATAAIVCDVRELPFSDARFDLVVANHMLYHVPEIDRAIGELRRVLRPGGTLVTATNGIQHMTETHELIATVTGRQPDRRISNRFSLENGESYLRRHFGAVERRDFDDNLHVTDAQAVIGYLESTAAEDGLTPEHLAAAHTIVSARIATDGAFVIHKSAGLFLSR